MSRQLVHPDQPWPVRGLLRVYQFCASLKLAVILILWLVLTFAVGTFVEARYGTPVAQFGVYQTWWFNLLAVLLAVNIFCAASIRFPWKRHQTGFVITHIGLLTLLLGVALSRLYGIDAQIFVYERQANSWALEDERMHFDLVVHRDISAPNTDRAEVRSVSATADESPVQSLDPIPFEPGPFSWSDYGTQFRFGPLSFAEVRESMSLPLRRAARWATGWMFSVAGRESAGQVLYNRDGIKLEVLDFLSDSRKENAPLIRVAMSVPRSERIDANGRTIKSRYHWTAPQTLDIVAIPRGSDYPFGVSDKAQFPGGTMSFSMTNIREQQQAFLANQPVGPLGERGQVVLFVDGKPRRFNVAEKLGGGPQPIAGTPWQVEIESYWPAAQPAFSEVAGRFEAQNSPDEKESISPSVQVKLTKAGKPAGRLVLFADQPGLSIQNYEHSIFGDYWFDHAEKSQQQRMMYGLGNRIDVLQFETGEKSRGDERFELYFRRWQKSPTGEMQIVASGKLSATDDADQAIDAFTMADQLKFYVQQHIGGDKPTAVTVPIPFEKDKNVGIRRPVAKVRLTVDDQSEEFWLAVYKGDPDFAPTGESQTRTVKGKDRSVSITLPMRAVDIGFRVQLENFERRLDPGTSQPSHYSSTVEFRQRHADRAIMHASLEGAGVAPFKLPELPREANDNFTASSIAVTADGQWLYWVNARQGRIERISRTQREARPETVVGELHSPRLPIIIAIDDASEQLYWVEVPSARSASGTLKRVDLAGENEITIASIAGRPTSLAIDSKSKAIFWSYRLPSRAGEPEAGAIGRCDLEGKNSVASLIPQMGVASSIAVDSQREQIYWTDPKRGSLRRASYDGTGVRRISLDGEQRPTSVAVDAKESRIYWTDTLDPPPRADEEKATPRLERHRIWTADLSGDHASILVGERVYAPQSLFVDTAGKKLWWSQDAVLRDDVWITMNAPVEFANPRTGHSYRLFQESFVGPFKPGSTEYEELVPNAVNVPELYASILTVNYDPGRWIRNIGCLLVVCGIATMFYMRAYFFRPVRRVETHAENDDHADRPSPAPLETPTKKQPPAKVLT